MHRAFRQFELSVQAERRSLPFEAAWCASGAEHPHFVLQAREYQQAVVEGMLSTLSQPQNHC